MFHYLSADSERHFTPPAATIAAVVTWKSLSGSGLCFNTPARNRAFSTGMCMGATFFAHLGGRPIGRFVPASSPPSRHRVRVQYVNRIPPCHALLGVVPPSANAHVARANCRNISDFCLSAGSGEGKHRSWKPFVDRGHLALSSCTKQKVHVAPGGPFRVVVRRRRQSPVESTFGN